MITLSSAKILMIHSMLMLLVLCTCHTQAMQPMDICMDADMQCGANTEVSSHGRGYTLEQIRRLGTNDALPSCSLGEDENRLLKKAAQTYSGLTLQERKDIVEKTRKLVKGTDKHYLLTKALHNICCYNRWDLDTFRPQESSHEYPPLDDNETKRLYDESMPFIARAQFLKQLILGKKVAYTDLKQKICFLPDSIFKEYAQATCIALNPKELQVDHFRARATLMHLLANLPRLEPNISTPSCRQLDLPAVYYGPLFKAFHEPHNHSSNHIHRAVTSLLINMTFPDSSYFAGHITESPLTDGFKQKWHLCVCDKETGTPIWISPKLMATKPFTIYKNSLYYANDTDNVICCNLINGLAKEVVINHEGKIINMVAIDQQTLLILYDDKQKGHGLSLVDLQNETMVNSELGTDIAIPHAHFIGNNLVAPTRDAHHIHVINQKDKTCLTTRVTKGSIEADTIQGNDQFIIYCTTIGLERKVTCLDLQAKKIWHYPLGYVTTGQDIYNPHLAHNKETIFALMGKTLFAFRAKPEQSVNPLLWKIDLNISNIDALYCTEESSVLYGIETETGKLYTFDIVTGRKKFLYQAQFAKMHHIVGKDNDTLYIQGTYFK